MVMFVMLWHARNLPESTGAAYLGPRPPTPMTLCRVAPENFTLGFKVSPREQPPREPTDRAEKQ
jgi:hypothetical protein